MPSSIWSDRLTSTVPTAGNGRKWLRFDGGLPASQKKLALHYELRRRQQRSSRLWPRIFCGFPEIFFLAFTHQIEAYWKKLFGIENPRVLNFSWDIALLSFCGGEMFFPFWSLSKFKRSRTRTGFDVLSKQVLQVVKMDSLLLGLCIIPIVP